MMEVFIYIYISVSIHVHACMHTHTPTFSDTSFHTKMALMGYSHIHTHTSTATGTHAHTVTHLVDVSTQSLETVHMQIAILHHTNDVSTVGADSNMVEAVLHSAHVKQQAAAVDVNEAHDAIL